MTREEAIAYGKRAIDLGLNDETQAFCELAIKALGQEPCGDTISRQAAIHVASGHCHPANIADGLSKLPPVQPKQRWIPVSERLPESFQRVLVTVARYNGDKVVRVAEYYNRNRVFRIKENNEQWEVGEKGLLAWMPLPNPYKAESENKKE